MAMARWMEAGKALNTPAAPDSSAAFLIKSLLLSMVVFFHVHCKGIP
jgi:hypothetical protein